MHAVNSELF